MLKKYTKAISCLKVLTCVFVFVCVSSVALAKGSVVEGASDSKPKPAVGRGEMKWNNVSNILSRKPGKKAKIKRTKPEWKYVPVRR